MREYHRVRQIAGEPRRRWFASDELDLIVRVSGTGAFIGFELCYDKHGQERSLSWSPSSGFSHMAVDSGEPRPGRYKETPILVPNGSCDMGRIYSDFLDASRSLPRDISSFVLDALKQHPDFPRSV